MDLGDASHLAWLERADLRAAQAAELAHEGQAASLTLSLRLSLTLTLTLALSLTRTLTGAGGAPAQRLPYIPPISPLYLPYISPRGDKIHEHPPPFVPQLKSVDDTAYFDQEHLAPYP